MRPIQFRQVGPAPGLAIGQGLANGLNQGLQEFSKMRMQRMQMEAHKMQAQAMMQWRQAQAESMRQKTLGSSLQDVQLMQMTVKGGHADPAVLKPLIKDRYEQILATARPEEKAALMRHMDDQVANGQVPAEITSGMNLNMNQMKTLGQMNAAQGRENVATTQAGARVASSQNMADSRVQVAQTYAGRGAQTNTNAAKVELNALMHRTGGKPDPKNSDLIMRAVGPELQRATQGMPPDAAAQVAARVKMNASHGFVDPQFQGAMNAMTPDETKLAGQYAANSAKLGAAAMHQGKAGAGGKPDHAGDLKAMGTLQSQMLQTSKQLDALDKPPPPGVLPMDDSTKAALKQKYSTDLADMHGKYDAIHQRVSNLPAPPAAAAPGAPARTLPADQWQSAKQGDLVAHPSGQGYVTAHGDGTFDPKIVPPPAQNAPMASPPPAAAPQAAPPASTGFQLPSWLGGGQ